MRLPVWIIVFWFLATVADTTVVALGPEYAHWRWGTKQFIVGSLLLGWITLRLNNWALKTGISAALLLYIFGDIFLLREGDLAFKAGLGAFLVGHACYVYTFHTTGQKGKGLVVHKPWLLFLVLGYALPVCAVILPKLGPGLLFPVVVYIFAICALTVVALNRGGRVPAASFRYGLFGALLFMVSDTLLAYSLFVARFPLDDVWVIATYGVAQFGLVAAAYTQVAPDLHQR